MSDAPMRVLILGGGFAGMRARDAPLAFAPRLPAGQTRLRFRVCYRDWRLELAVAPNSVSYTLLDGPTIQLTHHGEALIVTQGESCIRPIPACVPRRGQASLWAASRAIEG
jgi:alpha,alpha-trehalose phosphorylase